jgi:predicted metal-dependent phosphoesterase TrpH
MIDLHSHTTASDGTDSPEALVDLAARIGLTALAITDHDNFDGYDRAKPAAAERGLDLVCGIEISTRVEPKPVEGRRSSVHLLGYFVHGDAPAAFREWVVQWQDARRRRNIALVARLQELGVAITLQEAESMGGKMTGRPHFAQILRAKGYVRTIQQAFDQYLGDTARAAVDRDEPGLMEAIEAVRQAGGIPVLAHPVRLSEANDEAALRALLAAARERGLLGLEVWYSEHTAAFTQLCERLSRELGLNATGGSDYHGGNKPGIELGTGRGSLRVEESVLDHLRSR